MRRTEMGYAGQRRRKTVVIRQCVATGCRAVINAPLLMCVTHWRLVPAALQRQVWASFKRIGLEPDSRETHARHVQAAVDAVHAKQLARKAKADKTTPDLF